MNRTLIIAEAGVNHNGDLSLAKRLVEAAADAGADIVKFQTFITEQVISSKATKADYQKASTGSNESQMEMVKKLELKFDDFILLKKYAEEKGIEFASTAFDLESTRFLKDLGMRVFKIPSGEITNLPYLELIGSYNQETILSTGMATLDEIGIALTILIKSGTDREKISILHCNTEYPTPFEEVNLKAMLHIRDTFGVRVGYSDHTLGIEVPVAAVALGAEIIEKHFTLDNKMTGPDHSASLEPDELKSMVKAIRNIEKAIAGSGKKEPTESEKRNKSIARKSRHLKRDVKKGEQCVKEDLIVLRPGDGISPMDMNSVLGKCYSDNLPAFHKLDIPDLC